MSKFLDYPGLSYFKERNDIIYAASLDIAGSTITLKAKSGAILTSKTIDLSNYATKADVSTAIKYKGSVTTYDDLPGSPAVGDMYNVETASTAQNLPAGGNVVWNGSTWDVVGPIFAIDAIANSEIDELF